MVNLYSVTFCERRSQRYESCSVPRPIASRVRIGIVTAERELGVRRAGGAPEEDLLMVEALVKRGFRRQDIATMMGAHRKIVGRALCSVLAPVTSGLHVPDTDRFSCSRWPQVSVSTARGRESRSL